MKIRATIEFEVAEENKFAAAAAIEAAAKKMGQALKTECDGKIDSVTITFPKGPRAKK